MWGATMIPSAEYLMLVMLASAVARTRWKAWWTACALLAATAVARLLLRLRSLGWQAAVPGGLESMLLSERGTVRFLGVGVAALWVAAAAWFVTAALRRRDI